MPHILSDPTSPAGSAPFPSSSSSSDIAPLLQDMDAPERNDVSQPSLSRGYGTAEKTNVTLDARDHDGTPDNASVSSEETQAGVKGVEAISQTWSKWSLITAYLGIFLLAFATSLEQQTTSSLTPYATSSFGEHSLLGTISVVSQVVNAVIKPPMSKIANVFGRLEAYSFAILLYICGYIQLAGSQNVQTFASAQIFYSAGSQGLQILQQIFIADTSNLVYRALFASLPDTPFLVTTWVGPLIAQNVYLSAGWRWGYGIWAIVLPVAFLPLALSLVLNLRKAAKRGLLPDRPWKNNLGWWRNTKKLVFDLDIAGLLILSAAVALLLIPLTLAASANGMFHNSSIVAMLVVGCVCWVVFPCWELSPKLAPKPFLSLRMLKSRNVVLGCLLGFFYFGELLAFGGRTSTVITMLTAAGVFYTSVFPYFNSYLQVVQQQSIVAAGHITMTFSFASTVAAVVISVVILKTRHFKYFIVAGAAIYLMAVGLIMRYRVEGSSVGQLVGAQIALGIGGGMVNIPALVCVQSAVAHTDVAAATALFLTMVEIGGAVGAAISGTIWTGTLPYKLGLYLPESAKGQISEITGSFDVAKSFPIGSPERDAVNRSYQETMNLLLIVSLCFAAVTFILTLFLKGYQLDKVDQKVKGKVIGGSVQRTDEPNNHRTDEEPVRQS